MTGHTGRGGSSSSDRIKKYVVTSRTGENLAYRTVRSSEDMILDLIIDEGIPSRGHRKNIMSPDFTHTGISCGCHAVYGDICCFAFATDPDEKDLDMVANVAPRLDKCSTYGPETKGTITDEEPSVIPEEGTDVIPGEWKQVGEIKEVFGKPRWSRSQVRHRVGKPHK